MPVPLNATVVGKVPMVFLHQQWVADGEEGKAVIKRRIEIGTVAERA